MTNTSGTLAATVLAAATIGSGTKAKGAAFSPPAGLVDKSDKLDRPEHAAARTTCISTHPLYWGIGGGLVSYGLLSPTLDGWR